MVSATVVTTTIAEAVARMDLAHGSGAEARATGSLAAAMTPVTDSIAAVMSSPAWAAASGDEEEEEGGGMMQQESTMHKNSKLGSVETVHSGPKDTAPSAGESSVQVPCLIQQHVRQPGDDDALLRDLAMMQDTILHTLCAAGLLRDPAPMDGTAEGIEDVGCAPSTSQKVLVTTAAQSQQQFGYCPG